MSSPQQPGSSKWKFRFGAIISLAAIATIATTYSETSKVEPRRLTTSSTEYVKKVQASNEYGESVHGTEYPWLNGRLVVEPFRVTTLTLTPAKTDVDLKFQWEIIDPTGKSLMKTFGSSLTNVFKTVGKHTVTVSALNKRGTVLSTYNVIAHCLYIKREVRQLTEEDRENFLDAMHTMWSVKTVKGRELYGEDFTGMDRYVYVHAREASGNINCDKWHEGSGFLAHHLALATSFDLSLQSVDKRVTTPYWDFTIEGEKLAKEKLGPKSLSKYSLLLSEHWFGTTDALSHVVTSRWAHTPAIKAEAKSADMKNSFGFIRAPWNNAKDVELVRHYSDVCGLEPANKPIPSCATHYKVMNGSSLPDFLLTIAGYGHGPMHVNTGGVFGECTGAMNKFYNKYSDLLKTKVTLRQVGDAIREKTNVDLGWESDTYFSLEEMVQKHIHLEYFHIYRTLYRSQTCALDKKPAALTCPDSCDEDTPEADCLCTCAGIDQDGTVTESFDWKNLEPCMYGSDDTQALMQETLPESMREELVVNFCSTGVKEGEMLESASPLDPLFWMIHPVLDRMLVAKRLAQTTSIPYGNYGIIKPFVKEEEWIDYSFYTTDDKACEGHGMYDAVLQDLPMPSALIEQFDVNEDNVLSNIEFYEAVDPLKEDGATYIFDHFSWNHCELDTSEEEDTMFAGGVTPTKWMGADYKDLKSDSIKPSKPLKEHRQEAEAGLKPGKSLEKVARLPGSISDLAKVLQVIEANNP